MTAENKKTGLGRGISALIPDFELMDENAEAYFMCEIENIIPNRFQPRHSFSGEEMEKLKRSIADQGIIQPLLVRKHDDCYELIAGERRLRAAKMAELEYVPVLVKDLSDEQMLEISIIENVQRQNLNPLEEAEAYSRLISEFNYTQAMVARKIGKDRSTIANFIRLMSLPEIIKQSLIKNEISMGHARALLGAGNEKNQINAWKIAVEKQYSVRAVEKLVNRMKSEQVGKKKTSKVLTENPDQNYINRICAEISKKINSNIKIKTQGEKGKFEIKFTTKKEFQRLVKLLGSIS